MDIGAWDSQESSRLDNQLLSFRVLEVIATMDMSEIR